MVRNGTSGYHGSEHQSGDECSSTYEGRHIVIPNDLLIFVDAFTDGLVRKGQPVVCADIVGVALKTAQTAGELIPIDTEGIWYLSVVSVGITTVGQHLFITDGGVITDANLATSRIFGYALEEIIVANGPATAVIAVKVHWMAPEVPEGGGA